MRLKPISEQARSVAAAKSMDGSWSAEAFGRLLKELAAYDATVVSRTRLLKLWMTASMWLGLAGWVGGIALITKEQTVVAVVLMVASFVHIGVAATLHGREKPSGLPQDPLQMLHKFFRQIQGDVDPAKKVHAKVDFMGVTPAKRVSERQLDPAGFVSRTETIYVDAWCQLHFQLRDGSPVSLRMVDQYTDLDRIRLSKAGRRRSKRKCRKMTRVTATLRLNREAAWGNRPSVDPEWERLKVSRKRGQEAAVLDRWWLAKSRFVRPLVTPSGNEVVGMLFRLCSMRPVEAR